MVAGALASRRVLNCRLKAGFPPHPSFLHAFGGNPSSPHSSSRIRPDNIFMDTVALSQKSFGERTKNHLSPVKVGSIGIRVSFDMIFDWISAAACLHSRVESRQEILTFGWVSEFYVYELGRCSCFKQPTILLPTPPKGRKDPPQDRVMAEEGQTQ
jgi:hypothetical protein